METKIKKIVDYIKKNYNRLPKSKLDDEEVVIFTTGDFSGEYGYGSSDLEGYGVDKNGKLVWVYASGCSCNCGTGMEEKSIKTFGIEKIPDDVSDDLLKMIGLFEIDKAKFDSNIGSYIYNSY